MKHCGFCGKAQYEVKRLISAPNDGANICNACVDDCVDALRGAREKTPSAAKKTLVKPMEIKAFLDGHVISQDAAKTDIAVAVYNHYKRRDTARRQRVLASKGVEIDKSNIMLMGPTGSGKTELARSVAKMLGVPFYLADASRLTQAGYVGDDVESMLQGLIADAGNDIERAQWGIIFIDEIDKLARKSGRNASGYRDVTGEGVQQALLKLIEGSKVHVPRGSGRTGTGAPTDVFDTQNVLFIATGSFAGIEECVQKRINERAGVGFGAQHRQKLTEGGAYAAVTEADVLEFGIIPELMGRLPVLTSTLPLTEAEMVRVLTEPKNALVKQAQALFAMDGIDLQFQPEALAAIARDALRRPTGARALRSILESILKPYAYRLPSDPTVRQLVITKEAVEQKAEAEVIRDLKQA